MSEKVLDTVRAYAPRALSGLMRETRWAHALCECKFHGKLNELTPWLSTRGDVVLLGMSGDIFVLALG